MKKLFLILSVVALIGLGPVRPILHSFLPVLDPGIAHAQEDPGQQGDDDDQGDNDNQ